MLDAEPHPAIQAWREVEPRRAQPRLVEAIQHRRRSQVYRLRWPGDGGSVIAKRCRRPMTIVEQTTYRAVLPVADVRAPAYYGYLDDVTSDPDDPFAWLFIEDLGPRRYAPDDAAQRLRLARWLGQVQVAFLAPDARRGHPLPVRDAAYYQRYLHRAIDELPALAAERSFSGSLPVLVKAVVLMLRSLQDQWDKVVAIFAGVPMTLVHGDCLPKNIHVVPGPAGHEVVPIDWGNAGWGLPGSDLGQSTLLLGRTLIGEAAYEEYANALQPVWPECSAALVQRLATLGRLLWSVKVIAMSVPGFRYDSVAKVEQILSIYSSVLLTSLQDVHRAESEGQG